MSTEARELQESIEEFFKNTDDSTFLLVVDMFVYHQKSKSKSVNDSFNSFLSENGLTKHFENYIFDMSEEAGYFRKCEYSARGVIESLKYCFLSVSHNRFRKVTSKLLKNA